MKGTKDGGVAAVAKGRTLSTPNSIHTMNYMHDLRAELEKRLAVLEDDWHEGDSRMTEVNAFIKFILETVLESYKNGRDAAKFRVDKAEAKGQAARKRGIAAE